MLEKMVLPNYLYLFTGKFCPLQYGGNVDLTLQRAGTANAPSMYISLCLSTAQKTASSSSIQTSTITCLHVQLSHTPTAVATVCHVL